jgi:hypothetical protein
MATKQLQQTRHHRARFLAATDEPTQELDMRVHAVDLDAKLHDLRAMKPARVWPCFAPGSCPTVARSAI